MQRGCTDRPELQAYVDHCDLTRMVRSGRYQQARLQTAEGHRLFRHDNRTGVGNCAGVRIDTGR